MHIRHHDHRHGACFISSPSQSRRRRRILWSRQQRSNPDRRCAPTAVPSADYPSTVVSLAAAPSARAKPIDAQATEDWRAGRAAGSQPSPALSLSASIFSASLCLRLIQLLIASCAALGADRKMVLSHRQPHPCTVHQNGESAGGHVLLRPCLAFESVVLLNRAMRWTAVSWSLAKSSLAWNDGTGPAIAIRHDSHRICGTPSRYS